MEEVLLRDLFLFGLQDESFMSKIISEESPNVTIAQLQNKLKLFEAGRATAKYIKSGHAKEGHQVKKVKKHKFKPGNKQGSKPQNDFGKNNQGQRNNNWTQSHKKRKQPSNDSPVPPPKKQFQGPGQPAKKIEVWRYKTLTRLLMPCSKVSMQSLQQGWPLHFPMPHKTQNSKSNNSRRIGIPQCLAR